MSLKIIWTNYSRKMQTVRPLGTVDYMPKKTKPGCVTNIKLFTIPQAHLEISNMCPPTSDSSCHFISLIIFKLFSQLVAVVEYESEFFKENLWEFIQIQGVTYFAFQLLIHSYGNTLNWNGLWQGTKQEK